MRSTAIAFVRLLGERNNFAVWGCLNEQFLQLIFTSFMINCRICEFCEARSASFQALVKACRASVAYASRRNSMEQVLQMRNGMGFLRNLRNISFVINYR